MHLPLEFRLEPDVVRARRRFLLADQTVVGIGPPARDRITGLMSRFLST